VVLVGRRLALGRVGLEVVRVREHARHVRLDVVVGVAPVRQREVRRAADVQRQTLLHPRAELPAAASAQRRGFQHEPVAAAEEGLVDL